MRLISANHVTSAILALSLSLPVAAWAQTTVTTDATSTTTAQQAGSPRERVEQRIADMHATLHITAAQEPEWDRFSQVMLDNAQAMDAMRTQKADNAATATAAQIIQTYADVAQQHAQNVAKLSTAFQPVYASLTAEQKKAADNMFRMRDEEHQQKQGG